MNIPKPILNSGNQKIHDGNIILIITLPYVLIKAMRFIVKIDEKHEFLYSNNLQQTYIEAQCLF